MHSVHHHQGATYEIDDQRWRIDVARVQGWLASPSWSAGVSCEVGECAASGSSLVLGAYPADGQVGYLRVVSDRATFAWLADVFVVPAHRGRGLASALVKHALADAQHQGLRRWLLGTRDAHELYAQLGFAPLAEPERFMAITAIPLP